MIEWIKTRAILILGILCILLTVASATLGFMLFKGGIHITRNEYITTHSRSDSYASSGSLSYVLNIVGTQQQEYKQGKFSDKDKSFNNYKDAWEFYQSLGFGDKRLAHIFGYKDSIYVWFSDYMTQSTVKAGEVTTKKEEKLNMKEQ
jgi:hypothetical protein